MAKSIEIICFPENFFIALHRIGPWTKTIMQLSIAKIPNSRSVKNQAFELLWYSDWWD